MKPKRANRPTVQAVVLRRELRAARTEYNRLSRQATKIELRRQRIMIRSMEICRILDAAHYAQNAEAHASATKEPIA